MDERIPPPNYLPHSSPLAAFCNASDRSRYVAELFVERQKLEPFVQVLPFCSKLLNQEILRASGFASIQNFSDPKRIDHGSPLRLSGHQLSGGPMDFEGWFCMQTEENGFHGAGTMGWHGASFANPVKKVMRLDVPIEKFPNYNFVGRVLGPRGNSLKRVEATTQCRVYIRGRGSVKDSAKEEKLRDRPGYEHLNEPLHLLIEAELPPHVIDAKMDQAVAILEDLLKPLDESMDYYKKQQLRELAMLNGTLREVSPQMSPSASPFNGMKRAKTVR